MHVGDTSLLFYRLNQNQLEQIQQDALEELERNKGQYDEHSIVLHSTSKARAKELAQRFGAELRITDDGRYARLTLPEGATIRDVFLQEANLSCLEELSIDYRARISDLHAQDDTDEENASLRLPQRPQYTVSDKSYAKQSYLDYLNMKDVWESYTGSGVTVAVIDTGIDTNHPEFAGRISEYSYNASKDQIVKDYVLEDGSYDWSLIEDRQGHGTAVTGVIAASMNNGQIVGIAPDVTIITIKAECDENGVFERTSDLVFGLYYAIERDVQVVNMSFGIQSLSDPFADAAQLAYDSDVLCVAAAGNEATATFTYPAAGPYVIGVGAIDQNMELADYSNYGENSDVVAPGSTYTTLKEGKYGTMQGTSLASPIVTAAIALYCQSDLYTSFEEMTEILYASCYDLGEEGTDWYYGYGCIDLSAFLKEERGTVTFDMLTDEIDRQESLFIRGHGLQDYPLPERLYAVFDGWYYDDTFTQEVALSDRFTGDLTLYAKWINEDDGIPFTYVILDDGTVEISSYVGHRKYITVPEKIEGLTVSSIGAGAFANQTTLREVVLPSSLVMIQESAFYKCTNLTSITIPEKVSFIGAQAFCENIRLSTIAFSGQSQLNTIDRFAFLGCSNLEMIELPASLEHIDGSAFYGTVHMEKILVQKGNNAFCAPNGVLYNISKRTLIAYPAAHGTEYTLPSSVQTIGSYAFGYARIPSIDLQYVKTIEDFAFGYSYLKKVTLPDSLSSLGIGAFTSNSYLLEVTLGKGIAYIRSNAFSYCASLTQILIPNTVCSIDTSAFRYCNALQAVQFEENSRLAQIGTAAFADCAIEQIEFPDSLTVIGAYAFSGTCIGNPLTQISFGDNSQLRIIGANAFAKCRFLESVTLPDGLETIGEQSFSQSALQAITIPTRLTTLGAGAFELCTDLSAINVEQGNTVYKDIEGVVYDLQGTELHAYPCGNTAEEYTVLSTTVTIMPHAFSGANHLSIVQLPESLVTISEYAFYSATKLNTLHIPDSVAQIGRYAFAQTTALHTITFGQHARLPRISYEAFAYAGLTSFTVPANVSTIAQGAFTGCEHLTSITFAQNSKLESISAYMLDGCSALESIYFLPDSALTSVQAHGFEGMDRLTTLDFSNTKLTNIDNFAFRFCTNLSSVVLPDSVTSIGRYAFYGCTSLSELTVPASVEHIGSYAFLDTKEMDLYFKSSFLPTYLDENWDRALRGYYVGVSQVFDQGDFRCATLTSGDIAIIKYLGTASVVDLSAVDLGAPITAIGGSAFEGSAITEILLPATLTSIQAEAFRYSALKRVVIPSSVTFIGREVFAYTDIESLVFEEGSALTVIEQSAFEKTAKLTSVSLPQSLTTMGSGVFLESGLTAVTFEEGINLTEIPESAFAKTKLTALALPNSVTLVNHNAFNGVSTLKSLSFGENSGIRLMSNAFYQTGLEALHIPENVTYIGEYCFTALTKLDSFSVDQANPNYTEIEGLLLTKDERKLIAVPAGRAGSLTVPRSVEMIGFGAFEESALSEILFHEDANVLTFGYRAFFKAQNITTITIPASVVSIDYYAFAYCENLHTVYFAENTQLKGIYEGAFLGDIHLENITLPESIAEISEFAFYGCSEIESLPLTKNSAVKGIYDYAFAYTGLKGELIIPETIIDIGNYAFLDTRLTKVTIPDAQKKQLLIGIGAFEKCNELSEITLPFIGASYEDMAISWFGYIFGAGSYEANDTYVPESLKTVTISEGITFVGNGCYLLKNAIFDNVTLPSNMETIYITNIDDATSWLQNTPTLKNIVICDTVKASDLRNNPYLFQSLTGVTIYVEGLEKDLRWDDNFPGWSNGNRVVYKDDWSWTTFYDEDGTVLSVEPRLNSQIIVRPVISDKHEGEYSYVFAGWDLDGDGVADSLPATSPVDVNAQVLMEKIARTHKIDFVGINASSYLSEKLPYGAPITAPEAPTRKGYIFLGWSGYVNGMTADADYVFTAQWMHIGGEHSWSALQSVQPTCTEQGYSYKICSVCDEEVRSGYLPALGHNWGENEISLAPSCTEAGTASSSCLTCGEQKTLVISASGHDFAVTVKKEATCSAGGQLLYTCQACQLTLREASETAPHDYRKTYASKWWLEWLLEQLMNALFGYEGSDAYYYRCADCGHIQTTTEYEESKSTGSSIMNSVSCTHTADSWTLLYEDASTKQRLEGQYCTLCDKLFACRFYEGAQQKEDVDADGNVTISDVTVLLNVLAGNGTLPAGVGDLDNSGSLTISDVTLLLTYLSGE